MKQLWIVEFNSFNYCGASDYCLVLAETEDEAMDLAEPYANEFYYEQDQEQIEEDFGENYDDEYANIVGAEPVAGSDYEKYVNDPYQTSFYPLVA